MDTDIRDMCQDNREDIEEEQTNFLSILAAFKHYRYVVWRERARIAAGCGAGPIWWWLCGLSVAFYVCVCV